MRSNPVISIPIIGIPQLKTISQTECELRKRAESFMSDYLLVARKSEVDGIGELFVNRGANIGQDGLYAHCGSVSTNYKKFFHANIWLQLY
jgi:hypothetical protein